MGVHRKVKFREVISLTWGLICPFNKGKGGYLGKVCLCRYIQVGGDTPSLVVRVVFFLVEVK